MQGLACVLILSCLHACQSNTLKNEEGGSTTTYITHDTIPDTRDSVSKKPVATFTSTKGDKLQVKVFETENTFHFLMTMNYQSLDEKDTLRIPNFGIYPTIKMQPGSDGKSCVVGFLDTKNQFREYKLVTVKSGNLQVKVLKRYYAGRTRTEYPDTSANK